MALFMKQPAQVQDDPTRRALAAEIEAHRAATASHAATVAAHERADMAVLTARDCADAAAAAVEEAPQAAADYLQAQARGSAGTPPTTARERRDAALDANDALLAARSARDILQRRIQTDADRAALAGRTCQAAAVCVMKAEIGSGVADVLEELERAQQVVAKLGRVIEVLTVAGAVEADPRTRQAVLRHTTPPSAWGFQTTGAVDPAHEWQGALAALQADAQAPAVVGLRA